MRWLGPLTLTLLLGLAAWAEPVPGSRAGIPLYPGARQMDKQESEWATREQGLPMHTTTWTLATSDPVARVVEFYTRALPQAKKVEASKTNAATFVWMPPRWIDPEGARVEVQWKGLIVIVETVDLTRVKK